jgi:hypothetical protein
MDWSRTCSDPCQFGDAGFEAVEQRGRYFSSIARHDFEVRAESAHGVKFLGLVVRPGEMRHRGRDGQGQRQERRVLKTRRHTHTGKTPGLRTRRHIQGNGRPGPSGPGKLSEDPVGTL